MKIKNPVVAAVLALALGNAQAELFDRGGGLIYDDVLNVTWLQDANYAKTSGYDADGRMIWNQAMAWANSLVYEGYDDWRLPQVRPVGSSWNFNNRSDGTSDIGYNITSPASEMSYMYYVNLGLKGQYSPTDVQQSDFGVFGDGNNHLGEQRNIGLVNNLQSYAYWSGTTAANPDHAMDFMTFIGGQFADIKDQDHQFYAWAVRDGDVAAPIPEPETYAMLLAGLGLLGVVAKRRRQKLNA